MADSWRVDVVRHAHAGDHGTWRGPDSERPLTAKGLAQASALVALLQLPAGVPVLSSPAVRCMQTVGPLAAACGTTVAPEVRCAEGARPRPLLDFMVRAGQDMVLCSHGDVIGSLVYELMDRGVIAENLRFAKVSTWRLTCTTEGVIVAQYLPPPEVD